MEVSKRIFNLETETAFSILAKANDLAAKGKDIINWSRNMEENMQLTSVSSLHVNKSIWHDVLNSRKNFYSIIEEIYQASVDPSAKTNFKLGEEGVGAMSFRA